MTTHEPDLRFALRPNCLITRRPLVFLTPPRSLFWYKNPWQKISHILFEHGYKVQIFQLPFQKITDQKKVISAQIGRIRNSHIFLDSVTYQNLKSELFNTDNSTITVITDLEIFEKNIFKLTPLKVKTPVSYFLHQIWCRFLKIQTPDYSSLLESYDKQIWHPILNHCVRLAEIDFEKD